MPYLSNMKFKIHLQHLVVFPCTEQKLALTPRMFTLSFKTILLFYLLSFLLTSKSHVFKAFSGQFHRNISNIRTFDNT